VAFQFRWNDWNLAKCAKHGVRREEAQFVVNHVRAPFPRRLENQKILVKGQTESGRYLQVIYLIEQDDLVFVTHARG
jgi:uncharacterized DUF497 family protein